MKTSGGGLALLTEWREGLGLVFSNKVIESHSLIIILLIHVHVGDVYLRLLSVELLLLNILVHLHLLLGVELLILADHHVVHKHGVELLTLIVALE